MNQVFWGRIPWAWGSKCSFTVTNVGVTECSLSTLCEMRWGSSGDPLLLHFRQWRVFWWLCAPSSNPHPVSGRDGASLDSGGSF